MKQTRQTDRPLAASDSAGFRLERVLAHEGLKQRWNCPPSGAGAGEPVHGDPAVHAEDPPVVRPVRRCTKLLSAVVGTLHACACVQSSPLTVTTYWHPDDLPRCIDGGMDTVVASLVAAATVELGTGAGLDPANFVVHSKVHFPGRFVDGVRGQYTVCDAFPRGPLPPTHSVIVMYGDADQPKVCGSL